MKASEFRKEDIVIFKDIQTLDKGNRLAFIVDNDTLLGEQVHIEVNMDEKKLFLTPITKENLRGTSYMSSFDDVTINNVKLSDWPNKDDVYDICVLLSVKEY